MSLADKVGPPGFGVGTIEAGGGMGGGGGPRPVSAGRPPGLVLLVLIFGGSPPRSSIAPSGPATDLELKEKNDCLTMRSKTALKIVVY